MAAKHNFNNFMIAVSGSCSERSRERKGDRGQQERNRVCWGLEEEGLKRENERKCVRNCLSHIMFFLLLQAVQMGGLIMCHPSHECYVLKLQCISYMFNNFHLPHYYSYLCPVESNTFSSILFGANRWQSERVRKNWEGVRRDGVRDVSPQ